MSKRIVIFSHGFGVRRDSRGTFTEIAAALPRGVRPVLFDYNRYVAKTNRLAVTPLSRQVVKLRRVIARVQEQHPGAVIDLVCHSQGCIAAGLAKPRGLRNIILLAPPASLNIQKMADIFAYRPGAHLNVHGQSLFPRRDGSTTVVPRTFWPDLINLDPIALYNQLATITHVVAINAHQDEILGATDFAGLSPDIRVIGIEAGHDFTSQARPELLAAVLKELS